jgi:hypothetical protein
MAKHTPGPWHVEQGINDYDILVTPDGRAPARLAGYVEREADARLIAAAPELLEALRHLCGALNMSDDDHEDFADSCADVVEFLWQHDARALLARIEGGA